MKILFLWISCILLVLISLPVLSKRVEYTLVVDREPRSITGKTVQAITINSQLPGPTLEFVEGDYAVMHVENRMEKPITIHWHGLLVPNNMDGVPYVTNAPIMPGSAFTYEFPIKQSGTYWYHSHFGLQEQYGLTGSILIHPKERPPNAPADEIIMLADWNDERPEETLRKLKRDNEGFAIRTGNSQTLFGAIQAGTIGNVTKRNLYSLVNAEVSDIAYDRVITNGRKDWDVDQPAGRQVRLRVINGSTSTYFYLNYAGGPMTVIAADGQDIEPVELPRMLIAVAETYDILVTVPEGKSLEFRATNYDGSNHTSSWIGRGEKVYAPVIEKPNIYTYAANVGAELIQRIQKRHKSPGGMPKPDVRHITNIEGPILTGGDVQQRPPAPYQQLRSVTSTALPKHAPTRIVELMLTGDMKRYVWSMNGKTLSEDAYIRIRKGENVRFVLVNNTMMRHPMHLHGHFFRVVNGQGDYSPLKHTVDVAPMSTTMIEFRANEEKDWFFHCHILYHLESGMARIVHYEGTEVSPEIQAIRYKALEDPWYAWADIGLQTNMNTGFMITRNNHNDVFLTWESNWSNEYQATLGYYRFVNRFFSGFVGVNTDTDLAPHRTRAVAGFYCLLPFKINALLWADDRGNGRITISRELAIIDRFGLGFEYEYDSFSKSEYLVALTYWHSDFLSFAATYDNDYQGGVGVLLRF
ncbi:multicopper oxidase domain-containing protein [Microbulbifer spongiae]|uniref:Multicopper oxidase domain-containing protein n=1 Tax=Microbulbifer spongiae TaxID=2944933 RepID=A0ABY9EA93_9GAMM|nr:multicopper oxidase domain-containing protein [Microbulbifer sp. MI-G]WKD48811.1 multicopper oxidase domain-containing protein [Microbulbifer sp. MI-G]